MLGNAIYKACHGNGKTPLIGAGGFHNAGQAYVRPGSGYRVNLAQHRDWNQGLTAGFLFGHTPALWEETSLRCPISLSLECGSQNLFLRNWIASRVLMLKQELFEVQTTTESNQRTGLSGFHLVGVGGMRCGEAASPPEQKTAPLSQNV